MKQIAYFATVATLAHLGILLVHRSAHVHLRIAPEPWQVAFIVIVIFAAPVLATLILWTRWQKEGMVLFGLSMAGSLMFGLFYHFIVGGADNVIGFSGGGWISTFRATAVLLAAIEASTCAWVVKHVWRHGSYV